MSLIIDEIGLADHLAEWELEKQIEAGLVDYKKVWAKYPHEKNSHEEEIAITILGENMLERIKKKWMEKLSDFEIY